MSITKQIKLPFIKPRVSLKGQHTSNIKIQKNESKSKLVGSQRWKRKLSLNSHQNKQFEKRCLSQKRFSLKKISNNKLFQNLKQTQVNTHDNSESQKNYETFYELNERQIKQQKQIKQSTVVKKQDLFTINVACIFEKEKQKQKINSKIQNDVQIYKKQQNGKKNVKNSKNKLKCLVNPYIFERKNKHNNSDGINIQKKKKKVSQTSMDDFWNKINQSMILQCSKHQLPSKQLLDLVECIKSD